MSNPLVSICVPTYNRAAALRKGLADIRRQTYTPLEILISDNHSQDETEEVCREAARADSRIRYVRQTQNLGLYGNHNFCIEASRGEYLSFFHDHDERDPNLVSTFVNFLQQHPEMGVVSSDWELIDESGQCLGTRDHPVQEVTPGLAYIEQTIRSGRSSIGVPGALVRRSALGDIRFDEEGPIGFGDFVVWFQVAERWQIGHIKRRLWRWRQDRRSQSARTIESLARDYAGNLNAYCDAHLVRWPEHAQLIRRWRSLINRFLFWALVYELGLSFRHERRGPLIANAAPTLFEILDYRLSPEACRRVMEQMDGYRTGWLQSTLFYTVQAMARLRVTWPLAWATQHHTLFRGIFGLH